MFFLQGCPLASISESDSMSDLLTAGASDQGRIEWGCHERAQNVDLEEHTRMAWGWFAA